MGYIAKLKEADVSGVEPTAHANAVFNVFRDDAPRDWFTPEQALQMIAQLRQFERLDGLVVRLAVLVAGGVLPVDEVVVQLQREG